MQKDTFHSNHGSVTGPLEEHGERGNSRWYVVQTHRHSEDLAERHLSSQGFRTYLPKGRRTIRHARSIRTVSLAYFDCYLFVSLDIQKQRWSAINSTVGVRKLIMNDRMPIPVPYGIVDSLMCATDEEGILHPKSMLEHGQKIRVITGLFSEQIGMLDFVGRDGAVRVLLDIMNRSVPIYMDRNSILTL